MTKKDIVTSNKKNLNDIENNLGKISDNLSGIFKGLVDITSSAITITSEVGTVALKKTPAVIVAVAETRRKITETIADSIEEIQKEEKEKEFDDKFTKKIEQIKLKQKLQNSDAETRPKHLSNLSDLDE